MLQLLKIIIYKLLKIQHCTKARPKIIPEKIRIIITKF